MASRQMLSTLDLLIDAVHTSVCLTAPNSPQPKQTTIWALLCISSVQNVLTLFWLFLMNSTTRSFICFNHAVSSNLWLDNQIYKVHPSAFSSSGVPGFNLEHSPHQDLPPSGEDCLSKVYRCSAWESWASCWTPLRQFPLPSFTPGPFNPTSPTYWTSKSILGSPNASVQSGEDLPDMVDLQFCPGIGENIPWNMVPTKVSLTDWGRVYSFPSCSGHRSHNYPSLFWNWEPSGCLYNHWISLQQGHPARVQIEQCNHSGTIKGATCSPERN